MRDMVLPTNEIPINTTGGISRHTYSWVVETKGDPFNVWCDHSFLGNTTKAIHVLRKLSTWYCLELLIIFLTIQLLSSLTIRFCWQRHDCKCRPNGEKQKRQPKNSFCFFICHPFSHSSPLLFIVTRHRILLYLHFLPFLTIKRGNSFFHPHRRQQLLPLLFNHQLFLFFFFYHLIFTRSCKLLQ